MKSEKLTVYVNDRPKKLFRGLRVKHAVGSRTVNAVRAHRALVRDQDGNAIDIDGALYDQERLYVAKTDPTTYADDVLRKSIAKRPFEGNPHDS